MNRDGFAAEPGMRDAAIIRREEELREATHHDGEPEGRKDLHHAGIGFRPHRKPHDQQINRRAEHEQCGRDQWRGQQRIDRKEREQEERRVHRDHQELAMGEVHHVHQPEDQREADRDQAVEQPHQQTAGETLDDGLGGQRRDSRRDAQLCKPVIASAAKQSIVP